VTRVARNMAPTTFAAQYLAAADRLTPEWREKSENFIRVGYQKEQTYMHTQVEPAAREGAALSGRPALLRAGGARSTGRRAAGGRVSAASMAAGRPLLVLRVRRRRRRGLGLAHRHGPAPGSPPPPAA
jgi:hypothetical protein